MLIDSGVVRRSDGGWISAVDESGVPLPPTLEALLESRLDLLDEVEREVMERGSVEGKVFRFETIEACQFPASSSDCGLRSMRSPTRASSTTLSTPVNRRSSSATCSSATSSTGDSEEAARGAPRALRRVARRTTGERTAEIAEVIGYHFEQAYFWRGARGARRRRRRHCPEGSGTARGSRIQGAREGDLFAAINLLQRAVALRPDEDPARVLLLPELGEALTEAGRLSRQPRSSLRRAG